jgi:hypothetical protein
MDKSECGSCKLQREPQFAQDSEPGVDTDLEEAIAGGPGPESLGAPVAPAGETQRP